MIIITVLHPVGINAYLALSMFVIDSQTIVWFHAASYSHLAHLYPMSLGSYLIGLFSDSEYLWSKHELLFDLRKSGFDEIVSKHVKIVAKFNGSSHILGFIIIIVYKLLIKTIYTFYDLFISFRYYWALGFELIYIWWFLFFFFNLGFIIIWLFYISHFFMHSYYIIFRYPHWFIHFLRIIH